MEQSLRFLTQSPPARSGLGWCRNHSPAPYSVLPNYSPIETPVNYHRSNTVRNEYEEHKH